MESSSGQRPIEHPPSFDDLAEKISSALESDEQQPQLRIFPDIDYVYIDGYSSSTGRVGELRLHKRDALSGGNYFLFLNLTHNYKGVLELSQRLQDIDLPVTEIMQHPSNTLDQEEQQEIQAINKQLHDRWKEKQAASS